MTNELLDYKDQAPVRRPRRTPRRTPPAPAAAAGRRVVTSHVQYLSTTTIRINSLLAVWRFVLLDGVIDSRDLVRIKTISTPGPKTFTTVLLDKRINYATRQCTRHIFSTRNKFVTSIQNITTSHFFFDFPRDFLEAIRFSILICQFCCAVCTQNCPGIIHSKTGLPSRSSRSSSFKSVDSNVCSSWAASVFAQNCHSLKDSTTLLLVIF